MIVSHVFHFTYRRQILCLSEFHFSIVLDIVNQQYVGLLSKVMDSYSVYYLVNGVTGIYMCQLITIYLIPNRIIYLVQVEADGISKVCRKNGRRDEF